MIVGPSKFIEKTRWFRKAFGGGVRQVGPMAAAADYGLTHYFPRLAHTHALARKLADGLTEIGCELICPTETNMVRPPTLRASRARYELTLRFRSSSHPNHLASRSMLS